MESFKSLFLDVSVQEIQPLDVISVNIWAILISLANLVILFFIFKFLLFKPVKKMLDKRKEAIDSEYKEASDAKELAEKTKSKWDTKMLSANEQAGEIIKNAEENAQKKEELILSEANEKADEIIRRAEAEAELEKKKAKEDIKREITDISCKLAEKLIKKEVSSDDHHQLINSFIEEVGEEDGSEE